MNNRIFLLSRENNTIGVVYNETANKANRLQFTSELTTADGKGQYMVSAIDSVNRCLESLDVEKFTNVCQIYVTSAVEEAIKSETYKFWLMSGTNAKGEPVDEAVIAVWSKFSELMAEKGRYFVFRNIATCYIKDTTKANARVYARLPVYAKVNDTYARYCVEEMDKLCPSNGEIPAVVV